MAYKNILAYCNNAQLADRLFDVALRVAKQHDAHLTGLYIVPRPQLNSAADEFVVAELIEDQEKFFREQGDLIKSSFNKCRAKKSVKSDWLELQSPSSFVRRTLLQQSRAADLVIVNPADEDDDVSREHGLPENIFLDGGRPILIVPKKGKFAHVGERVLLAWNGSREATRAAFDALPILKKAKLTQVFELTSETSADNSGYLSADEFITSLKRHGVRAETASTRFNGQDVGEYLQKRAKRLKFDLIVMGGYGHSRITEFILGGATRHILQKTSVPILMSH